MRFEHIIEINSPQLTVQTVVPGFTRAQLWRGLMMRVQTPQRFPNGPESCDWQETAPGVFARTLRFGQHVMQDEVQAVAQQSLQFTPQPHGETAPIRLTITIEEPQAKQMVLRFAMSWDDEVPPDRIGAQWQAFAEQVLPGVRAL